MNLSIMLDLRYLGPCTSKIVVAVSLPASVCLHTFLMYLQKYLEYSVLLSKCTSPAGLQEAFSNVGCLVHFSLPNLDPAQLLLYLCRCPASNM